MRLLAEGIGGLVHFLFIFLGHKLKLVHVTLEPKHFGLRLSEHGLEHLLLVNPAMRQLSNLRLQRLEIVLQLLAQLIRLPVLLVRVEEALLKLESRFFVFSPSVFSFGILTVMIFFSSFSSRSLLAFVMKPVRKQLDL